MYRVLLLAEDAADSKNLRRALAETDHELTGVLNIAECDRQRLTRCVAAAQPQVVVIGCESPRTTLIEDLFEAMRDGLLPVVIFARDDGLETIQAAIHAGVAAYEIDGVEPSRLAAVIKVAVARFEFMEILRGELNEIRQKLADRRYVDRAKGVLMQTRGLTEQQAYHTLRRMAMERNQRIGEVARSLLDVSELL